MLTPKPKVWKLLKKAKKKWSHELKGATSTTRMEVIKVRAEPKTFGIADLKHICYTTMLVPLEWQSQRFIRTVSCEVDAYTIVLVVTTFC